jgi:hypothetical protein
VRRRAAWRGPERLEGRIALASEPIADVAVLSAGAVESRSVAVTYDAGVFDNNFPFDLGLYRSADAAFDASDVRVGGMAITLESGGAARGLHTVTIAAPEALDFDPARPFVLAVADPANDLAERNEGNNVASFRIYTLGAVTHGLELNPAGTQWVGAAAAGLTAAGYDVVVPFFWVAESVRPVPGQVQAAGARMAQAVIAAAQALPQDAVIDLHLIGHSRGGAVISQAMLGIEAQEQAGAIPQLRGIVDGFTKLTFLDPHPAHNVHTVGDPNGVFVSASPGPLGRLALRAYTQFQAVAGDPEAVATPTADAAEVYFQRATYRQAISPIEKIFNIWGEVPVPGATHSADLTGTVNGHFEVHDWYIAAVIPRLRTASPFFAPTPTTPPPPGRDIGPNLYEARVLSTSGLTRNFGVAVALVQRVGAAESAFDRGDLPLAARRLDSLIRLVARSRGRAVDPQLADLLAQQLATFRQALGG